MFICRSDTMNSFKIPNINDEKSVLKTIRLKYKTLERIEKLSQSNDISVNRLINECIEFALDNLNNNNIDKIEDTK